ncbi:MAG: hypothetical protein ACYC0J_07600 [Gammaproteobacteria bacterium]
MLQIIRITTTPITLYILMLIIIVNAMFAALFIKDIFQRPNEFKKEKGHSLLLSITSPIIFLFSSFGVSDFAISTILYRQLNLVSDRNLPGTLNTQCVLPVAVMALDKDAALKGADIITTVTSSNTPVFDGRLIEKGAHINGMGSYTPLMQELPEALITRASKIFFDTSEGVLAEAGDIIVPLKKELISANDLCGDLGNVYLGNAKGRETEDEITVFKSVGTAVLDVVTVYFIYQKAIA